MSKLSNWANEILSKLRTLVRTTLFYLIASIVSVPFVFLLPLFLVPSRWGWPFVVIYLQTLLFLLKWICGITYRIDGLDNIPDEVCLFASRHESTWENLFFNIFFDNPATFAKRQIFSYPIAGWYVRKFNHIATNRDGDIDSARAAFENAFQQSQSGRNILIFPHGSRKKEHRHSVKRGVFLLYSRLNCPCVPIFHNSGSCWPFGSWLKHPGEISVKVLPVIPPNLSKQEFLARIAKDLSAPQDAQAKETESIG